MQPADVITRHVLPELKRMRAQLLDQQQQQQQHPDFVDDLSGSDDEADSSSGGCSTAGTDPQLLVGYAAYLLHHQHLAARDPRVRQEWAHALLWVCVPPKAAPRGTGTCSTSQRAGGERALGASGAADASLASKNGECDAAHGHEEGEHNASRQPPKGWAVLPCNEIPSGTDGSYSSSSSTARYNGGVCLGLSFPALYTARHPAEAHAALAALAAALRGVPCALWAEGYGRYGSAVQWAEFCGPALLGCGFSFVRVCRRQAVHGHGEGQAPAGTGLHQRGVGGEGHGGEAAVVEDWMSSDLEAVLQHLLRPQALPDGKQEEEEKDTGLHAAAQQGTNDSGLSDIANGGVDGLGLAPQGVLDSAAVECLTAVAQLLDATWAEEYGRYASVRRLQPTAPGSSAATATAAATVAAAAAASGKAHATPVGPSSFLQLLRTATWLPDSWGGVGAPGSGALLLPTRAVRGVLGPAARYVAARLSDPRFGVALGLVAKPTVESVLGQLVAWQQAAGTGQGGEQQQQGQLQQQPGLGDLVSCYGYLWAEVCREQEQQEQEEGEKVVEEDRGKQRGNAVGGRVAAAVTQAFAEAPLVGLPAAALAVAPGRGGTALGAVRWCTAEAAVWSLGPLGAVVVEGTRGAAAAAAAAAALLPARLSEAYPTSLE